MTIVFTVMFYHFPSGLNLWLSSMALGILQQWLMTRKMVKEDHNLGERYCSPLSTIVHVIQAWEDFLRNKKRFWASKSSINGCVH